MCIAPCTASCWVTLLPGREHAPSPADSGAGKQCPEVNGPANSGCHGAEAPSVLTAGRPEGSGTCCPGQNRGLAPKPPAPIPGHLDASVHVPSPCLTQQAAQVGHGEAAWWRGDDPLGASHTDPSDSRPGDRHSTCCLRRCGHCHCHCH